MTHPRFSTADIFYIGLGGMLGSLLRWFLGIGFEGLLPVPTIMVNILGSAALGILYASQHRLHPTGRHLYMVGFCGSFTTVSLYSHETVQLFISGHALIGIINVALPVGVSLAVMFGIIGTVDKGLERRDT